MAAATTAREVVFALDEPVVVWGCLALRVLDGAARVLGAVWRPASGVLRLHLPRWHALTIAADGDAASLAVQSLDAHACDSTAEASGGTGVPGAVVVRAGQAPAVRPICIPAAWDALSRGDRATRLVVCGAKRTGKSTLCRHTLNTLLARHGTVALLDADCGQPMLTPPGLVSLHTLTAPVLTPSTTDMRLPMRAVFVGDTSPRRDPEHYAASVSALCDAAPADSPLVVNTLGWTKGIGRDLLVELVRVVRPADVVELQLHTTADAALLESELPPGTRLHRITTAAPAEEGGGDADARMDSAADLRARSLAAYFGALPLGAQVPKAVALAALRLHVAHAAVPPSQTLHALNGALVGLVADVSEAPPAPPAAAGLPRILPRLPLAPCVGLGVVQAADARQGVLHVTTPLDLDALRGVNTIVRGALDLPPALLTAPGPLFAPYLATDATGTTPHGQRVLQRRRL